jgi:Holliday junction resolvase
MNGRRSRDKGNRAERAIVKLLQAHGFASERVPLSGAVHGRFSGDVSVPVCGVDRRAEVKVRGNGFRQLYAWLEGHDFLVVRADRAEPLIVLRLKLAAEIAAIAERNKNSRMSEDRRRTFRAYRSPRRAPNYD